MILWMVLPLFLIGLGVYLVVKWSAQGSDRMLQVTSNRALDILAERYARGEIDADQYRRMKEELAGAAK